MTQAFAMVDAEGALVELFAGFPFTSAWLLDDEGETYQLQPINHLAPALTAWGPDELARYRVLATDFPSAPEGMRLASYSLSAPDDALVVSAVWALDRRLISKDVISARLAAVELLELAMARLFLKPILLGRWLNPAHPNVYADDPDLIDVLTDVGADIEAITAS